MRKKILLQTTIPTVADDWNIGRFHLLTEFLDRQRAADGSSRSSTSRRATGTAVRGPQPAACRLDQSDFDQMWLFAVDTGHGLTPEDCAAIARFRQRGGGLLVARDHMDLARCKAWASPTISTPRIGKRPQAPSQRRSMRRSSGPITIPAPMAIIRKFRPWATCIRFCVIPPIPARPFASCPPIPTKARWTHRPARRTHASSPRDEAKSPVLISISRWRSSWTPRPGRTGAIHIPPFRRLQLDIGAGAPSFVDEPPGSAMAQTPEAMRSTKSYAGNRGARLSRMAS